MIFRLIYSAGLRRSELIHLKLHDIETQDGKMRIRINKGKGKKDRYTVLSKKVLEELRAYYIKYRPKEYLFNGRKKGRKLSEAAIRHLCRRRSMLENARKRSGITKEVTMHVLDGHSSEGTSISIEGGKAAATGTVGSQFAQHDIDLPSGESDSTYTRF